MLVLSKKTQHFNEEGQWEPIAKYRARVGDNPAIMLEAIEEINLYLPEDWRLTRSQNTFAVLVVPVSTRPFKLVGRSYGLKDESVLHVIDSVFTPQMFDQYYLNDIIAGEQKEEGRKKVKREMKKEYSEIMHPNLYFFQACPDDSSSPLFARQYEKVKKDEQGNYLGNQYHRIHPLHKWGIDLDHYKWVEWNINGTAQFVDYPAPGYHGKDYWLIPWDQNRHKKDDYLEIMNDLKKEFQISNYQPPETPATPYEQEFKLCVPRSASDPRAVFRSVKDILIKNAYKINHDAKPRDQVDTYFDDDQFSIYHRGGSFRFRETKGSARITLKMRPPNEKSLKEKGDYRRMEEEVTISQSQKEALMHGGKISAFPYRLISYVVPDVGAIKPVVTVKTARELLEISNNDNQKAEVCFDIIHYEIDGKTYGPESEIEIESKGLPREEVALIAAVLQSDLTLSPSAESKYERAIGFLMQEK